MVALTSSLGRYAVLLSVVGFGKSNFVIADGSALMEPSSAAWADAHRQLAQCCVGPGGACHPEAGCNANQKDCESSKGKLKCNLSGSYQFGEGTVSPPNPGAGQCCLDSNGACHPDAGCNDNQKDCESSKGKLKCNSSGSYQWGDTGSPPPPPPSPNPTPLPVDSTPPPTSPPVSASCGLCVEDPTISCNSNAECPVVPSSGTCIAPSPQPTNGANCASDDECLPSNGKPQNRGTCGSGGTVETLCDPNLCPPTGEPTPLPTNAPTNEVSE